MARIRVLLVDESQSLVKGLAAWFDSDSVIEVVGTAGGASEALEQVERLGPDLVLVDVHTPPSGGFDAARRIKQASSSPLVVLSSFHTSEAARQAAAQAGADRFLDKSEILEGLSAIAREMLKVHAADSPEEPPDAHRTRGSNPKETS